MGKCRHLPERAMVLGHGVRHLAPECHVPTISQESQREEMVEQSFLRGFWTASYANNEYGRLRIDLIKRLISRQIDAADVASALREAAVQWPDFGLADEAHVWSGRAVGRRFCSDCGAGLAPTPPCDCGCQRGRPAPVDGWSLAGASPPSGPVGTADEAVAPVRSAGGPPGSSSQGALAAGWAEENEAPGASVASTAGGHFLGTTAPAEWPESERADPETAKKPDSEPTPPAPPLPVKQREFTKWPAEMGVRDEPPPF